MGGKSDGYGHQVSHADMLDGEQTGRPATQSKHVYVILVYSARSVVRPLYNPQAVSYTVCWRPTDQAKVDIPK